jgi:GNAT superfamily N-acetyltransferase
MQRDPAAGARHGDAALAAVALDTNAGWLALGSETFDAAGATFVRNPAYPSIRDANHVTKITAATPDEIAALFARADREFGDVRHRAFYTDYRTPPGVEARLALDGFSMNPTLLLLLEGAPRLAPGVCQIRELDDADAEQRAAFDALHDEDWREGRERTGESAAPEVGRMMTRAVLAKRPSIRWWVAYVDGVAAGYFSSWAGIAGVGQVEDLFVSPRFRRRGVAMALLHHCIAQARAGGAGPIVIGADPTDTPKEIYARMGFRPVALKRAWWHAA